MKQINAAIGPLNTALLLLASCSSSAKNHDRQSTADRLSNLDPQKVFVGTEIRSYHFV
jgi:hypothetical protein